MASRNFSIIKLFYSTLTSLRINLCTYNFQGLEVNKRLWMTTSRSCIKCLKSTCEIVFHYLHLSVEILQLEHEIRSFSEMLYKRGVLKNFSKFTDKHQMQSSGDVCQKMFLKISQNSQKNITGAFLWNLQNF